MSSTIHMDMALIATANILPKDKMHEVFMACVSELNGRVVNNVLEINGETLGTLTFNDRIILSFSSDYPSTKRTDMRNLIRDVFTRRANIAHKDYLYHLEQDKKAIESSNAVADEIRRSLIQIEKEQKKSEIAMQRQEMSECEALKAELMDAAVAQGYEVTEEKTEQGIQLQFVRREY